MASHGSVNTYGNDHDNSSKDEVQGNLSSQVTDLREKIQKTLGECHKEVDKLSKTVSKRITERQEEDELQEVEREILSLKLNLPALRNLSKAKSSTPGPTKVKEYERSGKMLEKLQNKFGKMSESPTIQGVRQLYDRLEDNHKHCLLCLTAFPENAIIKKRVLINWWVGLEFVQDSNGSMAIEQAAEKIFEELDKKGFIMLVHKNGKKRSPVPDSCQLRPFMWRVLITLATEAKFVYFNSQRNAVPKYSRCSRACLVEAGQLPKTFVDMNEQFIDSKSDSSDTCKVLQMGQWVVSPDHNINVDEASSLLREISTMKSLRYLSLHGVTNIRILPASLCKLSNVTILDLRACRSLERLPTEIGHLKELTYLDFSECYMISHMPKSLAKLGKLQVLKGFVLYHDADRHHKTDIKEEACTLSDLAGMRKLWKLSLRIDMAADLGDEQGDPSQLPELMSSTSLTSLTITWIQAKKRNSPPRGTDSSLKRVNKKSQNSKILENSSSRGEPFPFRPMKLDLRGYPETSLPTWVAPSNLDKLKKLYIRGGNLVNLNWGSRPIKLRSVKILRLKFLASCEIKWSDLRDHFPSLVYLEKFQCPKLTLFPCDDYGVWMDPHAREGE